MYVLLTSLDITALIGRIFVEMRLFLFAGWWSRGSELCSTEFLYKEYKKNEAEERVSTGVFVLCCGVQQSRSTHAALTYFITIAGPVHKAPTFIRGVLLCSLSCLLPYTMLCHGNYKNPLLLCFYWIHLLKICVDKCCRHMFCICKSEYGTIIWILHIVRRTNCTHSSSVKPSRYLFT